MKGKIRLLVVGGNIAGLRVAVGLARDFDVTLVDEQRFFEWYPQIHEIISGVKSARQLRADRFKLARTNGFAFVQARVEGLERNTRKARLSDGSVQHYDYCVLAIGSGIHDFGIPGVAEHALPMRSVAQAIEIRKRLEKLASGAYANISVVGAGLAGIEVVGELLRQARVRRYVINVIDAANKILPTVDGLVQADLYKKLSRYSVHMRTGEQVKAVMPNKLELSRSGSIRSDLTIWTTGFAPPALLHESGLATDTRSFADVDATLNSTYDDRVFAVGDAASLPFNIPKKATQAMAMGSFMVGQLRRVKRDRELLDFQPRWDAILLSLGQIEGFLIVDDHVWAARQVLWLKEAVYQAQMGQTALWEKGVLHPFSLATELSLRASKGLHRSFIDALEQPHERIGINRLELLLGNSMA